MKYILYLLIFLPCLLFSQEAVETNLIFSWDDPTLAGSNAYNNTYNEIWGVVANNREFAIMGSTAGTHFFDVTDPDNMHELPDAFVAGAVMGGQIIHRDYHDYQCYLYAVADEGQNSTLQIIDISDLPYSTTVVYDSNVLFSRSHNIFIDSAHAKLYACAVKASSYHPLQVYSLADPLSPALLGSYGILDNVNIPTIHDIYVRDNIAYMNGSYSGLLIADFSNMNSPDIITTIDTYPHQGYNHSGWLSDDGNYYFLADETHDLDVKVFDVSDLNDIQLVSTFNAESQEAGSIAHNLIARGDFLYMSYYYDGLQVFDISDPTNPRRAAYYDTYPGTNILSYEGAWGVYPLLPSGKILLSDMQSGLFVFEKVDNAITGVMDPLGSPTNCAGTATSTVYLEEGLVFAAIQPQPFNREFILEMDVTQAQEALFTLTDLAGKQVVHFGKKTLLQGHQVLNFTVPGHLSNGMYLLRATGEQTHFVRKVIKQ